MNFPLFIAQRIFASRTNQKQVSRPAITIATIGMAIGMAVMIVSICVVLGFKDEIRSKLFGFGSHIQVMNMEQTNSFESFPIVGDDSVMNVVKSLPDISHVQRYITKPCLLKTEGEFRGVALKGVGPEYHYSFLKAHLIEGEIPVFSDKEVSNKILISESIANDLKIKVGDKIYCYFMGNSIRARRYVIAGIYCTHLMEFDNNFIFTDLSALVKLNGWEKDQVSGLEISVGDYDSITEDFINVVHKINGQIDRYGDSYFVCTIEQLYPSLFAWLGLLDMNVWVILILMLAVAGFTMISGLLIIILERTNMIGVLKALGATNKSIRHIFLYFAIFIIGKGLIYGNILGLGLCLLQKYFSIIHLDAQSYYVDTVPILINPLAIVLLNLVTLIISVLVLVIPSFLVSHIHPARSIRFE